MKKALAWLFTLCVAVGCIVAPSTVQAESVDASFVAPELSPDAAPYDAEHPEQLSEDQIYAVSALLMEEESGEIIFEKNIDQQMSPASTTKIMTVLLGCMYGDLNATVTINADDLNIESGSSTLQLKEDEEINFQDLLYGTILRSGNEAANAIARTVSGSVSEFVNLMNETAVQMGCTATHFNNPHGLTDPDHYTTARDLAIIARTAMQNDLFRTIVNTRSYDLPRSNKQKARTINTNIRWLQMGTTDAPNEEYYQYGTGIKSGSTNAAGYCFVGSAEKDGVKLISVVLYSGDKRRFIDTNHLMDYGFAQYVNVSPAELYAMNPVSIQTTNYSLDDSNMGQVELLCTPMDANASAVSITATKEQVEVMASNLRNTCLFTYTRDFIAPITAGESMGTMTYVSDDGQTYEYQLTASRSIDKRENAPKTLEEIEAAVAADPNPFPPFTFEMALYIVLPVGAVVVLVLVLRKLLKRRRVRMGRMPKVKNRYLK